MDSDTNLWVVPDIKLPDDRKGKSFAFIGNRNVENGVYHFKTPLVYPAAYTHTVKIEERPSGMGLVFHAHTSRAIYFGRPQALKIIEFPDAPKAG